MKKVLFTAITLAIGGMTFAQTTAVDQTEKTTVVAEEAAKKTEIKIEELPAAVKETLGSENFKDLKIEKAFLVEGEIKFYEIILLKGEEKVVVNISEEGKIIA